MQSYSSISFLLLVFCVCLAWSNRLPYDTLVCFGDSTTDTGNVFNLTGNQWPPPPYYRGRFSDGPIWVERLNISNLQNYAYGGATTDSDFVTSYIIEVNLTIPGVRQQINTYRNITDLRQVDFSRTLYAIWAGRFDYISETIFNASSIIDRLGRGIQDLIEIGVKNVLIVNEPPFGGYPDVYDVDNTDVLDVWTAVHNGNLSNLIQRLRNKYQNISFYLLDAHKLIQDILLNSTAYGISNISNCWSVTDESNITLCTNPSTYLFFDEYHFTSGIHQFIADRARNLLLISNGLIPYPLSCSLYLLISLIILSKNFI